MQLAGGCSSVMMTVHGVQLTGHCVIADAAHTLMMLLALFAFAAELLKDTSSC